MHLTYTGTEVFIHALVGHQHNKKWIEEAEENLLRKTSSGNYSEKSSEFNRIFSGSETKKCFILHVLMFTIEKWWSFDTWF